MIAPTPPTPWRLKDDEGTDPHMEGAGAVASTLTITHKWPSPSTYIDEDVVYNRRLLTQSPSQLATITMLHSTPANTT